MTMKQYLLILWHQKLKHECSMIHHGFQNLTNTLNSVFFLLVNMLKITQTQSAFEQVLKMRSSYLFEFNACSSFIEHLMIPK